MAKQVSLRVVSAGPLFTVLIVDDERGVRFSIADFLAHNGFTVTQAESVAEARLVAQQSPPDVAIVDYLLGDGTALDLLPTLFETRPGLPVIVLTAHGSIDLAVRCVKEGAEQFLTKPVELPALLVVLRRMVEQQRERRKAFAASMRRSGDRLDPFAGKSALIRELAEQARRVLDSHAAVVIQGETGTGKNVLAHWLHECGPRADEPFVDINCAGLSAEFLQDELFGHEPGAFTGAADRKLGLFEVANHGTVLLDEVGDVDPHVQPKLLKVIDERCFRRLGAVRDIHVDVRLMSATNADLSRLVDEGKYRRDLFFRLSVVNLLCPSLRERPEDVPTLAGVMLERLGAERGVEGLRLTAAAEKAFVAYAWPGNLRELHNVLDRALLLSGKTVLDEHDFSFARLGGNDASAHAPAHDLTLAAMERQHILRTLEACAGNVARAAQHLGVPRSSLYQKLKRYGVASAKG